MNSQKINNIEAIGYNFLRKETFEQGNAISMEHVKEIEEHCYICETPGYDSVVYYGELLQNDVNTWIWKFIAQNIWGSKISTLGNNNTTILRRIG